jgi:hypothetical protein
MFAEVTPIEWCIVHWPFVVALLVVLLVLVLYVVLSVRQCPNCKDWGESGSIKRRLKHDLRPGKPHRRFPYVCTHCRALFRYWPPYYVSSTYLPKE